MARQLCAICDSTNDTADICESCHADPANVDWCEPSEYEQSAEDVDVTVATAGGDRLESVFGGRRKGATDLARRVVQIALRTKTRVVRRRRRNVQGHPLRGWHDVHEGVPLRQIASEAGCSAEYVRQVLRRIFK